MVRRRARGLLACVALLTGGLVACGADGTLDLRVVLPEGADPLAGVDELALTVTQPTRTVRTRITEATSFSVEFELDVNSEVSTVVLEGLTAGVLRARGQTPPFLLRPVDDTFKLLVARAGALSPLRPRLSATTVRPASCVLPSVGVLLAGGEDARTGVPRAAVTIYDFYEHELASTAPTLPEPRAGAVAASCGGSCAIVALGRRDARTLGDTILGYSGGAWRTSADGLSASQRRSDASIAALATGDYLVVGGIDSAGVPLRSMLRLSPQVGGTATLSLLASAAKASRRSPAVATSGAIVLIAGGHGDGEPSAEFYFASSDSTQIQPLSGPEPRDGSAAVELGNGRFALLGGRDAAGQALADGWLIDPVAQQARHIPKALAAPRWGHQVVRVGHHIVIVGGRDAKGLAAEAEVLSADKLTAVKTTPLQRPREGHVVAKAGPGGFLMLGGKDAQGGVDTIEVYQTSVTTQ